MTSTATRARGPGAPTADVAVLGVRHHGPGSARSVAHALDELAPAAVVIEGAPELDALVALAASPDLVPPVAGLVYAVDEPRRAAFYPLASFSPEWVALRWAVAHDVPVRFADLPAANALAPPKADAVDDDEVAETEGDDAGEPIGVEPDEVGEEGIARPGPPPPMADPITTMARLAGYDDAERWWEDAVEHRPADSAVARFGALSESMAELRAAEDEAAAGHPEEHPARLHNRRREAAMRKVLREVAAGADGPVAVVCGAYHAPALDPATFPPATQDAKLLRGLPRTKVAATWSPWTAGRLAAASGYGAGVDSPGWYEHLFTTDQDVVASWLVRVAGALRGEQLDASTAAVVEATRLAHALAAVRGRPSVGLSELNDATQAVLADGSPLPLQLITDELVVGHRLGSVPPETPMVPLAADLAREQRRLRLTPSAAASIVTLDLRKERQLARSVLFHRLTLLGIDWALPVDAGRTAGTFKEAWQLEWRPELAVALIEASVHGTTVPAAATAKVRADAEDADDLATLAGLVAAALDAELPDAVDEVVHRLEQATAQHHDTVALLGAVEPLARTARYGDVRGADTGALGALLSVVVARASVGLRAATSALDDDGAARLRGAIEAAHRGIALVDDPELGRPWLRALAAVAAADEVHGSVSGRANRLLLDAGQLELDEAGRRLSRRLSTAADAAAGAAWLDGFLAGDAVLLLHDPALLDTVDRWVAAIDDRTFEDLLPLLRRTFARFERAERRQLGERLREGSGGPAGAGAEPGPDLDRAAPAMRTVARLLGLDVTDIPPSVNHHHHEISPPEAGR